MNNQLTEEESRLVREAKNRCPSDSLLRSLEWFSSILFFSGEIAESEAVDRAIEKLGLKPED